MRSSRALTVLALLVGGTGPAWADDRVPDAEDVDDDEAAAKAEAKSLMASGVALIKAKDYLGALAIFQDAYARYPSPNILLNIGTTLKQLGRNAEAANTYQAYLDAPDANAARKVEVSSLLDQLDLNLAILEIRVEPDDAEIQVNLGEWQPAARARKLRVAPGPYEVRARKQGFVADGVTGQVGTDEPMQVAFALSAEPIRGGDGTGGDGGGDGPIDGGSDVARPRGKLGVMAHALFDVKHQGSAAAVGLLYAVHPRVEVSAGAILGPTFGAFVGVTGILRPGRWQPTVNVALPMFFDDETVFGGRGALGLEFIANRNLSLVLEVGGDYYFNPAMDIDAFAFLPSLGAHGRL